MRSEIGVEVSAIQVLPEVEAALAERRPVVALETSIVAQGLPHPSNLEAAMACEEAVRARGAVPATIGVVDGEVRVGLAPVELLHLGDPAREVAKLSTRDLGRACATGLTGATTVAATCSVAARVGIRFFATGGIGGVHRRRKGRPEDQSADLWELARCPVAVFCAGAKSILDVPATLERLESLSVPVWGYACDEFPAFYTAASGQLVPRLEDDEQVARALAATWELGGAGVVVAVAPPEELAGAAGIVEQALAETAEIEGQAATPAALARVAELSAGRSVEVNIRLVVRNTEVAAGCAAAFASLQGDR